jgi:hypothetical protein
MAFEISFGFKLARLDSINECSQKDLGIPSLALLDRLSKE